jgi:hypothetical protein
MLIPVTAWKHALDVCVQLVTVCLIVTHETEEVCILLVSVTRSVDTKKFVVGISGTLI